MKDLNYNFVKKEGKVVSELLALKAENPSFKLQGGTDVRKVISYCQNKIDNN